MEENLLSEVEMQQAGGVEPSSSGAGSGLSQWSWIGKLGLGLGLVGLSVGLVVAAATRDQPSRSPATYDPELLQGLVLWQLSNMFYPTQMYDAPPVGPATTGTPGGGGKGGMYNAPGVARYEKVKNQAAPILARGGHDALGSAGLSSLIVDQSADGPRWAVIDLDSDAGRMVIFRGSTTAADAAIDNSKTVLPAAGGLPALHLAANDRLMQAQPLWDALSRGRTSKLYVAGHSLGGELAMILYVQLKIGQSAQAKQVLAAVRGPIEVTVFGASPPFRSKPTGRVADVLKLVRLYVNNYDFVPRMGQTFGPLVSPGTTSKVVLALENYSHENGGDYDPWYGPVDVWWMQGRGPVGGGQVKLHRSYQHQLHYSSPAEMGLTAADPPPPKCPPRAKWKPDQLAWVARSEEECLPEGTSVFAKSIAEILIYTLKKVYNYDADPKLMELWSDYSWAQHASYGASLIKLNCCDSTPGVLQVRPDAPSKCNQPHVRALCEQKADSLWGSDGTVANR